MGFFPFLPLSGAPSGPAGGSLTGTFPSPTLSTSAAQPWGPADSGYLAWNFDPGSLVANGNLLSAAAAAGTPYLMRVNVRSALSVTNVLVHMSVLGATLTAGQNFAGLFSSAGTLIATSADQTAVWNTGGTVGIQTIPLTGGPFALTAGFVWVALLWNGTTSPTFGRAQNFSATPSNAGTAAASARWAASGSTLQTSLPASITPAGNVFGQLSFWAALS